jgi:Glycogen debranching enzyme
MDNLPRCDLELIPDSEDWQLETFHHSYMSWIDATLQAAMSCEYLIMMAEELGISDDVDALRDEYDNLVRFVNEKMWSEKDGFYYDLKADGSFLAVKTVAAFWALIAKIAPTDRVDVLCRHLEDQNEFNRPNRVPALSADHPDYKDNGGYWNGGVWAPADYMILCGLSANGKEKLAKEIAECCYKTASRL